MTGIIAKNVFAPDGSPLETKVKAEGFVHLAV
ncbi:MAG: DUF2922 domain-containing protein [Acetobacterium sp.]|nr:DUF2922 domain-containing protein [Acetobacterium sp.]